MENKKENEVEEKEIEEKQVSEEKEILEEKVPEEKKSEEEKSVEIIEEEKVEPVLDETQNEVKPVDDNSQEEQKEVEKVYNKPITFLTSEDIFQGIEDGKQKFEREYKRIRNSNLLIMLPIILIAILGISLSSLHPSVLIITVVLVIIGFVFIMRRTKSNKTKLNDGVQNTILNYFIYVDSYVTSNEHFTEVQFNEIYKLDQDLFESLHIVKDIIHVGGRDEIIGKVDDVSFVGGDYLVKTREITDGKTQDYIVFLGKLFVFDLSLVKAGRAIIYLKGKGANGPTDIDDVEKIDGLLSDEKYVVYASCDIKSILTPEIIDLIDKFERNEVLIDMFISIDKDRVAVGLSYNDGLMSVPLFDKLNTGEIEQYKSDVNKMVDLIVALKK